MRAAEVFRRRPSFQWTALTVLTAVNAAVFFLQSIFAPTGSRTDAVLQDWFALSADGLASGKVWQLLTYSVLHQDIWHILGNMFVLWWAGRPLQLQGPRHFLTVYFGGVLLGAITFIITMLLLQGRTSCLGASAGVFAVLAASFFQHYDEKLRLLFFFIIPFTVRGKIILGTLAIVTVGGMAFNEIPATLAANNARSQRVFRLNDKANDTVPAPPRVPIADGGIAHSAHLGGLLFSAALFLRARRRVNLPVFLRRRRVQPFRQVIAFKSEREKAPSHSNTDTRSPNPVSPHSPGSFPPQPLHTPHLPQSVSVRENPCPPVLERSGSSNSTVSPAPAAPPHTDNTLRFKVSHRWTALPAMSEVNRILDKITASGFASLTQAERETLERASAALKK